MCDVNHFIDQYIVCVLIILINIYCIVCDVDRIIDQYVAAIDQHKDKLFDGQRLMAYKIYLIEAGAVTAKEFNDIEKKHKRSKPKMEDIIELLLNKRELQRFIGLSAVMFRYAEVDADEMFPFVSYLGDLHPAKGRLTVKKSMRTCKCPSVPVVCVCVCMCVCMCMCVCVYVCVPQWCVCPSGVYVPVVCMSQ